MHLTVAETGVLCILLFGIFHYLGILAKTRSVLAFLGAASVGLTGTVGRIAGGIAGWAQHMVGTITTWAFGVSLSAALFIVLAILLVHDLHPRKSASGRTGYVALAVGILLVAGVAQFPALAPAVNGIRSLLSGITNFINTL
jgi:hypothetical protein